MNKDCRNIWKTCFRKVSKVFELCKPAPMKIRAYTDRSRCSSTLTVLSDRRESVPSFLFQGNVPRLDLTKPRASSLNLPVNKQRIALSNLDIEIRVTPPPNELDTKSRCHSVPIFLLNNLKELDSQRNNDINTTTYPVNRLSGEFGSVDSLNHSDDSDVNSEAPMERVNFIREMSEYSSKLWQMGSAADTWKRRSLALKFVCALAERGLTMKQELKETEFSTCCIFSSGKRTKLKRR